jgi:hypothetical protein
MSPRLRWATHLALACGTLIVLCGYTARVFDLQRKEYGEGPILVMLERWRHEAISASWLSETDCTISCYGPGYYAAVWLLSPLTPWDHTLIPGRLISLLALVGTAALLALIIFRHTRSAALAQAAPFLYLVASPVVWWLPYARVDSLAVFFALSAYAAVGPRTRHLLLSALLIVLGSLVKQPVALATLPICVYLFTNGRRRAAVAYLLSVGMAGTAVWSLLAWTSQGYFFRGAILGNLNPLILDSAPAKVLSFGSSPLFLGALLALGHAFVVDRQRLKTCRYAFAFLVSATLTSILIAKEGSSENYYLETAALAVLVVTLHGLNPLWTASPQRAGAVLLTLACVFTLVLVGRFGFSPRQATPPSRLAGLAAAGEGGVLADGTCLDVLVSRGKLPIVNDPYLHRVMTENGALKVDSLVTAMASGRVAALVLERSVQAHLGWTGLWEFRSWAKPVVEAMARHYVLVQEEQDCLVYLHRSLASPGQVRGLKRPTKLPVRSRRGVYPRGSLDSNSLTWLALGLVGGGWHLRRCRARRASAPQPQARPRGTARPDAA